MIKLEGIVTALPGTFSSQSFYVGSENDGGVQIYQNKKDFPELMLGDRVEVTGKISESLGMKRINIAAKKFVDILDTDQFFNIKKVSVSQALDLKTGSLVQIEGEITQLKSSFFYLDDGKELRVDLKQSAHISKNDYMVGDKVLVTGILEKNTKETHLLPRSNEDVEIVAHVSETSGSLEEGSTSTMMKKIIVLGASGVVLVVVTKFGLFLKQRKNDIKK
jgi:DNA/RNA endonuclease YhcR with UshA esterase domain